MIPWRQRHGAEGGVAQDSLALRRELLHVALRELRQVAWRVPRQAALRMRKSGPTWQPGRQAAVRSAHHRLDSRHGSQELRSASQDPRGVD